MIKWWIGFAIAVPLSYMFGVQLAHSQSCPDSDTRQTCILNALRLKELKDFSCKMQYKVLYDDLMGKYKRHQKGLYRMPASDTSKYERIIKDYERRCVPKDPIVDAIEKNEIWPRAEVVKP